MWSQPTVTQQPSVYYHVIGWCHLDTWPPSVFSQSIHAACSSNFTVSSLSIGRSAMSAKLKLRDRMLSNHKTLCHAGGQAVACWRSKILMLFAFEAVLASKLEPECGELAGKSDSNGHATAPLGYDVAIHTKVKPKRASQLQPFATMINGWLLIK